MFVSQAFFKLVFVSIPVRWWWIPSFTWWRRSTSSSWTWRITSPSFLIWLISAFRWCTSFSRTCSFRTILNNHRSWSSDDWPKRSPWKWNNSSYIRTSITISCWSFRLWIHWWGWINWSYGAIIWWWSNKYIWTASSWRSAFLISVIGFSLNRGWFIIDGRSSIRWASWSRWQNKRGSRLPRWFNNSSILISEAIIIAALLGDESWLGSEDGKSPIDELHDFLLENNIKKINFPFYLKGQMEQLIFRTFDFLRKIPLLPHLSIYIEFMRWRLLFIKRAAELVQISCSFFGSTLSSVIILICYLIF